MLKTWLSGLLQDPGPIAPATPFYVIGDIHGRLDLLVRLLDLLLDDHPVICVGDYVDRGNDSAGVVRYLQARPDILCLKGNHEDMLLAFLDAPDLHEARWLHNGGLQTLESFGIAPDAPPDRLRDTLVRAMGPDLIAWLRALPCLHLSGNVAVAHAGANPRLAMGGQKERHLLWGHPEFGRRRRKDGMWVVYGHRITDTPFAARRVVAVDTGAYASGCLTAARIETGSVTFVQARETGCALPEP